MQRDIESGAFREGRRQLLPQRAEDEPQVEFHPYDEDDARRADRALDRCAPSATPRRCARALERVARRRASRRNVMPAIVAAVKAYASVGEITASAHRGLRPLPRAGAVLRTDADDSV